MMEFIKSKHTIERSVINDKQHGSILYDSILEEKLKLRDSFPMNFCRMENFFDL